MKYSQLLIDFFIKKKKHNPHKYKQDTFFPSYAPDPFDAQAQYSSGGHDKTSINHNILVSIYLCFF